jgi:hypothetical protein
MATSFFHKLVLATASTTLGLNVYSSLSATAATVTYDFYGQNGQNVITGSFSYDDSSVNYYPNPPEAIPCPSYPPSGARPIYCASEGFSVPLTDFLVNVNGNVFTESDAQTFNIIWKKDYPEFSAANFVLTYTGLQGSLILENPYLDILFYTYPEGGSLAAINTGIGGSFQEFGRLSFNLRNIEPTSVPEGQQELALLGLGLVGFISLLKKKLSFSQHN